MDMPLASTVDTTAPCRVFCCVVILGDGLKLIFCLSSRLARHSKVNDTVWMATQAYLLLYNTAQVR